MQRRERRRLDALIADNDLVRRADDDPGAVIFVEGQPDAAIFPDLAGNLVDVVGKIAELGVEARHRHA